MAYPFVQSSRGYQLHRPGFAPGSVNAMASREHFERLELFDMEVAFMPTDETRRLLKVFGVAVTAFEDAVDKEALPEELRKAEAEVRARLEEITVLIELLRARRKS
jgi:hypothetical protein